MSANQSTFIAGLLQIHSFRFHFLSEEKQIFPDIFSSVPDMAELVKLLRNLTAEVNHTVGWLDIPAG